MSEMRSTSGYGWIFRVELQFVPWATHPIAALSGLAPNGAGNKVDMYMFRAIGPNPSGLAPSGFPVTGSKVAGVIAGSLGVGAEHY